MSYAEKSEAPERTEELGPDQHKTNVLYVGTQAGSEHVRRLSRVHVHWDSDQSNDPELPYKLIRRRGVLLGYRKVIQ
jgi:hypothetical protein